MSSCPCSLLDKSTKPLDKKKNISLIRHHTSARWAHEIWQQVCILAYDDLAIVEAFPQERVKDRPVRHDGHGALGPREQLRLEELEPRREHRLGLDWQGDTSQGFATALQGEARGMRLALSGRICLPPPRLGQSAQTRRKSGVCNCKLSGRSASV